MTKPVILTGLRANNDLHIGNYFGALLPMIDMATKHAGEYQINLFVPDLHSFTTPIDHSQLYGQIMHNLKLFVAAGLPLDNPDIHIYRQSYIPAHSELTWILDCFTSFGEMRRMTQFKDKTRYNRDAAELAVSSFGKRVYDAVSGLENDEQLLNKMPEIVTKIIDATLELGIEQTIASSVGLFNYPVLMAADILLYGATYVPVGEDQTQHLEFTRDIAERMNGRFGGLFVMPKPVSEQHKFFGKDQGLRIKDLVDPTKKMSKSDETGKGVIFLGDNPDAAAKKIMSATTDSFGKIDITSQDQPGIKNLLQILALLEQKPLQEVVSTYEGRTSYGELKKDVAEHMRTFLSEFQSRLANVDETALQTKLEQSEADMRDVANTTLYKAQKAVGLRA